VKANQADFPVRILCRVLRVSASGNYDWRERAPSARALADAGLMQRISQIHRASDATYGAPQRWLGDGRLTVSLGATVSRPGNDSLSDVLRRADMALLAAKRGGRDRVVVDEPVG